MCQRELKYCNFFLSSCHSPLSCVCRWWRRPTPQSLLGWCVVWMGSIRWWSTVRSVQRLRSCKALMGGWCTALAISATISSLLNFCRWWPSKFQQNYQAAVHPRNASKNGCSHFPLCNYSYGYLLSSQKSLKQPCPLLTTPTCSLGFT